MQDKKYFEKLSEPVLIDMIKQRAQIANVRLRSFEASDSRGSAYRYIEEKAQNNNPYLNVTKDGKPRFSSATRGKSKAELVQQLTLISNYLSAKTSTLRGYEKAYKQAYETYTKGTKDRISYDDYRKLLESKEIEYFKANFYSTFKAMIKSGTAEQVDKYAEIIKNSYGKDNKTIRAEFKEVGGKFYRPSDDDVLAFFNSED